VSIESTYAADLSISADKFDLLAIRVDGIDVCGEPVDFCG